MRKIIYSVFIIVFVAIISLIIVVKLKIENKKSVVNSYEEINFDYDKVENYYNEIIKLSDKIKKNATRKEKEIIYSYYSYPRKAITELCKKNGNWELLPIDDELYEMYNEKDGILGNINFDSIEGIDEENDVGKGMVVVTNGKQKIRYLIGFSYGNLIHSVEISEKVELTDFEGKELDTRYKFIDNRIAYNFNNLCDDGAEWEDGVIIGSDIAITENFRKKYPLFLDLFTHYSPLDYNPITFVENKSRLNNHMAYFIVTSVLECKEREYEVYFQLDDNYYLDDAYAVCVKEKELEPKSDLLGAKIYYKNSNWTNLPLTESFKNRFNNSDGTFDDIDKVRGGEIAIEKIDKDNYIFEFLSKDNKHLFYLYKQKYVNGELDDIIYTKLPYENMSIKEVKELYLKDVENNNN